MAVFALSFVHCEPTPSGREQKKQQATTNRKQTEGESQGDTLSGTADTMGGAFVTQNVKQDESQVGIYKQCRVQTGMEIAIIASVRVAVNN